MGKVRKTLFLSEMEKSKNTKFKFQAPYIFYDCTLNAKWREDMWYFDDPELVRKEAKLQRFHIA